MTSMTRHDCIKSWGVGRQIKTSVHASSHTAALSFIVDRLPKCVDSKDLTCYKLTSKYINFL